MAAGARDAAWLATARTRIAAHPHWYHRIAIADGLVTPGINDSTAALARLDAIGLPASCAGLRVLDIGCRDGFFAFEAERRGAAEVIGIDQVPPESTGFAIASDLLGSRVAFRVDNVYALTPEHYGTFDLVLFLGVLYHLRHPAFALDRLRALCRDGARFFVETEAEAEPQAGTDAPPLWRYYEHGQHADRTVKWVPNAAGLAALVRDSRFDVVGVEPYGARCLLHAAPAKRDELEFFQRYDRAADVRRL